MKFQNVGHTLAKWSTFLRIHLTFGNNCQLSAWNRSPQFFVISKTPTRNGVLLEIREEVMGQMASGTTTVETGVEQVVRNVETIDELRVSKDLWVKSIQKNHFSDLIRALKPKKPHPLVKQLNVAVDENGLLRCFGRLEFAELPTEAVQPKLLPKNDHVTRLIVKQTHEKLCHSGVSHTLSQVRREFWIPHGRNTVRKIITRCIVASIRVQDAALAP